MPKAKELRILDYGLKDYVKELIAQLSKTYPVKRICLYLTDKLKHINHVKATHMHHNL